MEIQKINREFIEEWEKSYDLHENDDEEYKFLIKQISLEINSTKTLSKQTFIRILHWKSPRLKGIVKIDEYNNTYRPIIETCIKANNIETRISQLLSLYGIHTPTASTILHFIYPSEYPIIDIRTLETLNHFNLILSQSKSENNYWIFYKIIHQIKEDTGYSLRKIDRALFSFHKIHLMNNRLENIKSKIAPPKNELNIDYPENEHLGIISNSSNLIQAVIRCVANYKNGEESYEINIDKIPFEKMLPVKINQRIDIDLEVAGLSYIAGLRMTERYKYIWISPDLKNKLYDKFRLVDLLKDAGFQKNEKILLTQSKLNYFTISKLP